MFLLPVAINWLPFSSSLVPYGKMKTDHLVSMDKNCSFFKHICSTFHCVLQSLCSVFLDMQRIWFNTRHVTWLCKVGSSLQKTHLVSSLKWLGGAYTPGQVQLGSSWTSFQKHPGVYHLLGNPPYSLIFIILPDATNVIISLCLISSAHTKGCSWLINWFKVLQRWHDEMQVSESLVFEKVFTCL